MGKNIAVFVDGTGNRPDPRPKGLPSNTRLLFEAAAKAWGPPHVLAYVSGIGTGQVAEVLPGGVERFGSAERFNTGATGHGMAARIRWIYRFLSKHFADQDDQIFLFGFSRGAFAARSLAGFAGEVGLLGPRATDADIEKAYRIYENFDRRTPASRDGRFREILPGLQRREKATLPIHMIGVWDTVEALGLPGPFRGINTLFTGYHKTELPRHISHARQALAIHELREAFEPVLWMGTHPHRKDQSLRQVWFPGVHSDVGGGFTTSIEWARLTFAWMAKEARDLGLAIDPGAAILRPFDLRTPINDNARHWRAAEFHVRPQLREWFSLKPATLRTIEVHPLVIDRLATDPRYAFDRQWVDEYRRRADQASLQLHLVLTLRAAPSAAPADEAERWWLTNELRHLADPTAGMVAFMANGAAMPADAEEWTRHVGVNLVCRGTAMLTPLVDGIEKTVAAWREALQQSVKPDVQPVVVRLRAVVTVFYQVARLVPANVEPAVTAAATRCQSAVDDLALRGLKPLKPFDLRKP